MTGRVKWFNAQRGYGFVEVQGGESIFVHYSGVESASGYPMLAEGQSVEFEVQDGPKGPRAARVVPVPQESPIVPPDLVLAIQDLIARIGNDVSEQAAILAHIEEDLARWTR